MAGKASPVATRKTNTPSPNLFQRSEDEGEETLPIPAVKKIKKTYHLPNQTINRLAEVQFREQLATGHKPDLSELVAEAIEQFANERLAPTDGSVTTS